MMWKHEIADDEYDELTYRKHRSGQGDQKGLRSGAGGRGARGWSGEGRGGYIGSSGFGRGTNQSRQNQNTLTIGSHSTSASRGGRGGRRSTLNKFNLIEPNGALWPRPRRNHRTFVDNGFLYVIGGSAGRPERPVLRELLKFNLVSHKWTRCTLPVDFPDRLASFACHSGDNGASIVYAGTRNSVGETFKDVYMGRIVGDDVRIERIHPIGCIPDCGQHVFVSDPVRNMTFSIGNTANGIHVYALHRSSGVWKWEEYGVFMDVSGACSINAILENDSIYIFGSGHDFQSTFTFQKILVFNIERRIFSFKVTEPDPGCGRHPYERSSHSLVQWGRYVIIAGGYFAYDCVLGCVWSLNLDTLVWKWMDSLLIAVHSHSASVTPEGQMLVFGGHTLFRLRPRTKPVTTAPLQTLWLGPPVVAGALGQRGLMAAQPDVSSLPLVARQESTASPTSEQKQEVNGKTLLKLQTTFSCSICFELHATDEAISCFRVPDKEGNGESQPVNDDQEPLYAMWERMMIQNRRDLNWTAPPQRSFLDSSLPETITYQESPTSFPTIHASDQKSEVEVICSLCNKTDATKEKDACADCFHLHSLIGSLEEEEKDILKSVFSVVKNDRREAFKGILLAAFEKPVVADLLLGTNANIRDVSVLSNPSGPQYQNEDEPPLNSSVKQQSTFTCGVCFEEYNSHLAISCVRVHGGEGNGEAASSHEQHLFCRECVSEYAKNAVEQASIVRAGIGLKCMQPNCTDGAFLYAHVDSLLQGRSRMQLEEKIADEALSAAAVNVERCLSAGCSWGVILERSARVQKVFVCRACGYKYCRICKIKWTELHRGKRCEEFNPKGLRRKVENELSELAKEGMHHCPTCNRPILISIEVLEDADHPGQLYFASIRSVRPCCKHAAKRDFADINCGRVKCCGRKITYRRPRVITKEECEAVVQKYIDATNDHLVVAELKKIDCDLYCSPVPRGDSWDVEEQNQMGGW